MISRHDFESSFGTVSIALAIASLAYGVGWLKWLLPGAYGDDGKVLPSAAKWIVGIWVLFPPVFLWSDWLIYYDDLEKAKLVEAAMHTHELLRNVWIALAIVLVALYNIKWPGPGAE